MKSQDLVKALAAHLRVTPAEIRKIVRTAPYRYKHYQIEKRSGGKRDIYHPTPELKAIQRWVVAEVLASLPVGDAVSAYEDGNSIKKHALRHFRSNYFLKIDFKDFFPSIDNEWLHAFISMKYPEWDEDSVRLLVRVLCRSSGLDGSLALSIGAPSSPSVSNRILFDMDAEISRICSHLDVVYSRYADDLYFSTQRPNVLPNAELKVRAVINLLAPKLRINEEKTHRASRKNRISVTGLIITPQRSVSLGRDAKRRIKTEVYLWSEGRLPLKKVPKLRGFLTYAADVEPEFLRSLERKFGEEKVSRLIRGA
ncbi:MAG: retron St85 family RNA-directed DNA polymerase [Lysobacteraceae bacterium]